MSLSFDEIGEALRKAWNLPLEEAEALGVTEISPYAKGQTKGGRMKTWRIGRLMIAWGTFKDDKETIDAQSIAMSMDKLTPLFDKLTVLMAGTHHIAKNPRKGAERKRREK